MAAQRAALRAHSAGGACAHVPPFLCLQGSEAIMRSPAFSALLTLLVASAALAQPSAPVVTRTDVIYGRVEGSALLANIAYPDGPGPQAGHPLGARRALARRQPRRCQQHQGGAVGRIRLLRHVDRLPPGRRVAGAGSVPRPAVRDPLGARPRRGVPDRSRAHLSHRPVGRRPAGVAGRDHRRGRLSARRRLGEGAQRRPRGGQRRRRLRAEHAVVGQSVDAGVRRRPGGARRRRRRSITSRPRPSRSWSSTPTTTSPCRCSRRWTWRRS